MNVNIHIILLILVTIIAIATVGCEVTPSRGYWEVTDSEIKFCLEYENVCSTFPKEVLLR